MITGLKTALVVVMCLIPLAAQAAWDLDSLGAALAGAAKHRARVEFHEERHLSYLSAPLESSGYLVRDGDRLEKHVTTPRPARSVIDGNRAEIETADGERHSFMLSDVPLLQGLATALRAALAGDLDRLRRTFDASLEGGRDDWRLRLFPRDQTLRDALRELTLAGSGGTVHRIRLEEAGGDSSVMVLEHPSP